VQELLLRVRGSGERPVYLAVRSYQAWLEHALEDAQAQVSPRQALMVKHLVKLQRIPVTNPQFVTRESRQAEPTASSLPNASMTNDHSL
jgi:hypothetical protein